MAQTAIIPSKRHELKLDSKTTKSSLSEYQVTAPIRNLEYDLLNSLSFITLSGIFIFNGQHKFVFQIAEKFQPHFILIKGLIEFYRAKEHSVVYRKADNSFEINTLVSAVAPLHTFLGKIQDWLIREIEFKATLRKVIAFEDRYKKEKTTVYEALFNSHS
jgi:hypothetical protein